MLRRPLEFWWITVFLLFEAARMFAMASPERALQLPLLWSLGAALALTAGLLISFSEYGRATCLVLAGVMAWDYGSEVWPALRLASPPALGAVLRLSFCVWAICYLQSASVRRLCRGAAQPPGSSALSVHALKVLELSLGVLSAWVALALGAPLWLALLAGGGIYFVYGLWLESRVRAWWLGICTRVGDPFASMPCKALRQACQALVRGDLRTVDTQLARAGALVQTDAAGRLCAQLLAWKALLKHSSCDGPTALCRAAYDHDWKPDEAETRYLADYIECGALPGVRKVLAERAVLLEELVATGLDPGNFFFDYADGFLSRITGVTFAFNTHESWAAWWRTHAGDWRGDAAGVALVVRLVHCDADRAAHRLALLIAQPAEEPLLREMTAQLLFLNAMQNANKHSQGVEMFVKQPQRMLLMPELADALGLLHADSQLLENMGLSWKTVSRRLHQRVPLVDYIRRLWQRYPHELNADMPWLVRALTGKRLGIFRARAKFEAWWPTVRRSFIQHDRSLALGLAAFAKGEAAQAEKAFQQTLAEQPAELSPRYNLALCMLRRNAHGEAARLVQELTQLEPREWYWWLVLGHIQRKSHQSQEAHFSFRQALRLGAAAPKIAFQIGLTFANDQRYADAIAQLNRFLGCNPPPAKIEALVSLLESEGHWQLAGHYREEAFRRGLNAGDDQSQDWEGNSDFLRS